MFCFCFFALLFFSCVHIRYISYLFCFVMFHMLFCLSSTIVRNRKVCCLLSVSFLVFIYFFCFYCCLLYFFLFLMHSVIRDYVCGVFSGCILFMVVHKNYVHCQTSRLCRSHQQTQQNMVTMYVWYVCMLSVFCYVYFSLQLQTSPQILENV